MSLVNRYTGTLDGHRVELEFDRRLQVLNRATLRIDGADVDKATVFYGDKELRAQLPDGTEVLVQLHSGVQGELRHPQLQTAPGTWVDLVEA